jgi:hypothetical protein
VEGVPVVEAEEGGGEEGLDGVEEGGIAAAEVLFHVVAAEDLEEVGFVDEVEDVLHVLGFIGDVVGALLVPEGICVVLVQ